MDRSQIIKLVREYATIYGTEMSERLFRNLTGVSSFLIQEHFANWNELRVASGLIPAGSPASPRPRTTEAEIVEAFRKALEKHGPRLSLQTFCQETGLSERVIYHRCGSWSRLRLDAGLPARANAAQPAPAEPKPARERVTAEQILDRLRAEVDQHGGNISFQRFCQLTGFSQRLIVGRFGRWSNLRRAAGLSPCAEIPARYSRDDLLDDLLQVYQRTGANPKMSRYRCDGGRISTVTIRACFGSWPRALAALQEHRLGLLAGG